jgi:hypothetical protein
VDLERDRSLREVVDGQQRIRALLEYIHGDYSARHPEHKRKVTHGKLTPDQKRRFRETQLSGAWLLGASDADVIEVFGRLNSVSKTLNSSEKRNALYSGEFKQFCLRQAASRVTLWRELGIFSATAISRMEEIEFVADVVLNLLNGLSDFRGAALDKLYKDNEDDFPHAQDTERRLDACFSKIASTSANAFTDTIFSRAPLFFSLVIALDSLPKAISSEKLTNALHEIDTRYKSDSPIAERQKSDAEFYEACRASTQRISSRRIRDRYLKRFLS